jgi:hypothetical protein
MQIVQFDSDMILIDNLKDGKSHLDNDVPKDICKMLVWKYFDPLDSSIHQSKIHLEQ